MISHADPSPIFALMAYSKRVRKMQLRAERREREANRHREAMARAFAGTGVMILRPGEVLVRPEPVLPDRRAALLPGYPVVAPHPLWPKNDPPTPEDML